VVTLPLSLVAPMLLVIGGRLSGAIGADSSGLIGQSLALMANDVCFAAGWGYALLI
jgi:hypothetical protein